MPNPVTYLSGNTLAYQAGMFKRGTTGQNLSNYLTGNYVWWNGVDQSPSQYLIYCDTYTTGASSEANVLPSAWSTPDLTDTSLLNVINSVPELVGQPKFSYTKEAVTWLQERNSYYLMKTNYENIVTNGLVFNIDAGWYPSSNGQSVYWYDTVSGLTGTLYNGVDFTSQNSGGYNFDGTDEYVSFGALPLNSPLSFTNGNFTLEHWIEPTGLQGSTYFGLTNMILSKGPASTYNYATQVVNATSVRFYHRDNNEGLSNNTFTIGNILNVCTHLAFVVNTAGTQVTLYVNGISWETQNLTGNPITPYDNDPLLLGGLFNQPFTNFIGNIYINRIYNRALTSDEIYQNYNAQKNRFGSQYPILSGLKQGLLGNSYYSYPDSGSYWLDISGNDKKGTLENGTAFNSAGYFSFDGTDDYVNLGVTNTIYTGNNVTWDVQFLADSTSGYRPLFGNDGIGSFSYIALHLSTGSMNMRFEAANDSGYPNGNWFDIVTSDSFTINEWGRYTITYDGAIFRFYKNGVATNTYSWPYGLGNNNQTLYMGRFWAGTWNGDIGAFNIYNRTLFPYEVASNYYQGNIVTSNLLFYYDAGNLVSYPKSGTSTRNLTSLSTNVGTLNNGVGFSSNNGGYFTFDGTDDNINIGTVGGYSNQMTCEAWFRTTSNASWKDMICGPVGDVIFTVNNNVINFGSQGSSPIPHTNYSNTIVNTGAWFYAAATYNGSTVNIYINGVLDASYARTGSQTPGNLRIGSNDNGTGEFFNGDLPIVRMYSTALSQSQIIQNFNAQKSRFGL